MFEFDKRVDFRNSSNDVLTIGELLIDMIATEYGDDFGCDSYRRYFGGSPSNIAINVKRLGIKSVVASCVGNDGMGDFLVRKLEKEGVDTGCIQRSERATSMVMITKSQGRPMPIFYRGADYELVWTESLRVAVEKSKLVHFSCWPISCEPARDTVLKVLKDAVVHGMLVCFDPNYHPAIWEKGEDNLKLVREMIARADIVKPSEDDAERIFGADTPENQIEKFHRLGAKLVIMTLGSEGAMVSNGMQTMRFHTLATEVIDTTGAGDAFWSGFYTGLIKGCTLKESIEAGMATSAYKLRFAGAVTELPAIEEIQRQYGLKAVEQ